MFLFPFVCLSISRMSQSYGRVFKKFCVVVDGGPREHLVKSLIILDMESNYQMQLSCKDKM